MGFQEEFTPPPVSSHHVFERSPLGSACRAGQTRGGTDCLQQSQKTSGGVTLKTSPRYLKGVGPERSALLTRLDLHTLEDLFYFFPRRYEDRRQVKSVSDLMVGKKECAAGIVSSRGLIRTRKGQTIFKVVVSDKKGHLFAVWFNQSYLVKVFLPRSKVVLYGKVEKEGRHFQMVHPEYEFSGSENVHSGRIVPIYSLTEDLYQKSIRALLFRLLKEKLSLVRDSLPLLMRKRLGLVESAIAFKEIHFPSDFESQKAAYRRLVFDEFFLMQLYVQIKKNEIQREDKTISHLGGEAALERLIGSLDFSLTQGQRNAMEEIVEDMKKPRPMNRLVQGDVGSGKTAVAAAGLAFTVANGFQGALMAPTEVLAQQHFITLTQMLEPLGISCGYLAQGVSPEEKSRLLNAVTAGEIKVLVGTHALIQEPVKFKKLGLAVIDEQHKFGVMQRAALVEKGWEASAIRASADERSASANRSHFLLMTATPIPRTLAMTLYGDLDISNIVELPKGRKPITTLWTGEDRREEIYRFVDSLLAKGGQGYVICPLIAESGEFSPKSLPGRRAGVLTAYQDLTRIFDRYRVGILHGKMKSDQKKRIMTDFKEKRLDLLISTTVIEVGIDVPNANFMIVENAEKFGLAQLHQLRGRVGRGSEESFCVLFSEAANEESRERLAVFEKTQSGFDIANEDLRFRGAGELVGEKQHGFLKLRIGDMAKDVEILEKAKREAKNLVEKDPRLDRPEHRLLKARLRGRFKAFDQKITVLA